MSMTTSRLLRRRSDSFCSAQSKLPCPAAARSARFSAEASTSAGKETANSTLWSPPSLSRWMLSMLAPWLASAPDTACRSSGPSRRAMAVTANRCRGAASASGSGAYSSERPRCLAA